VDITGNCLSDLIVFSMSGETKMMEIWVNTGSAYVFNGSYPLPAGAGQVSFADFGSFFSNQIYQNQNSL
jgi:hypothetical protein